MNFHDHLRVGDVVSFTAERGALLDGTVVEVLDDGLHDIELYAVQAGGVTYLLYADEVLVANAA